MLFADDLAVIAETEDDLIERLNEWKDNVENRGVRVNVSEVMWRTSELQKLMQKVQDGHVVSVVAVLVVIQYSVLVV